MVYRFGPDSTADPHFNPYMDGDNKADPALYRNTEGLYIWFSSMDYRCAGPFLTASEGYSASAADFDGDHKADPVLYANANGYITIWLSGNGYIPLINLGPLTTP